MPEEREREGGEIPSPETDNERGTPQATAGRSRSQKTEAAKTGQKTEQKTRRHRQLESNLKLVLKGLK